MAVFLVELVLHEHALWALERDFPSTSIITHSGGLHAPIHPLRRPPAVGGCRAHAWGGSAGEGKPSRPAGAAEMATDGAVVMVHRRGCAPQIRWVWHRRN